MTFLSRTIFARLMRRRPVSAAQPALFAGTHVGRRLLLLHYVPGSDQMEAASRIARAELELRDAFSRLPRAGGENTGLARDVQRTRERVDELLEEPAGWLPRVLTRWPSSNANVVRALDAVVLAMERQRDECDRLARDVSAVNEARRALSELERRYARDLALEWQRAVVDRELVTRPAHVRSSIAVRRFGEEIEFLKGHLAARYEALVVQQQLIARELRERGADVNSVPNESGLEEEVEQSAELLRQESQRQMMGAKQRIEEASADHLRQIEPTNKEFRELPKMKTVDDSLRRRLDLHNAGQRRASRAGE